jgi:quinol monooxygenase YgiN
MTFLKQLSASLFTILAFGVAAMPSSRAQEPAPAYLVTYFEVVPKAERQAADLLRQQAKEMRKSSGNLEYAALQRIVPGRHFAIIESWKDTAALDAAHASDATKAFRSALTPLLSAPYDERPHKPMLTNLDRTRAGLSAAGRRAVFVVTHVDLIPPKQEEGIAATKALFAPSSAETGNIAYDILQQNSRPNHMTLFEIWKSEKALDDHESSDVIRSYRQSLLPMGGALYDQRTFRLLP